ncbi:class I glutamine amidotransferase-like protein [Pterulicium gracile]|uniref:D-lactate dehydratase n=1 Tax=Pterulicium gracile TaxID=1884261 RepID=A0A5C3Q699_9AGAR|nr:class I glutamine amidotransferase-like protein [Pterula gracilis]
MTQKKALIVLTSCNKNLRGGQTGWCLPEAAHPYYVLSGANYDVTFTSPKGPNPPVDEGSVQVFKDDAGFLFDPIVAEEYDAVFYAGGHGPVIDLAVDSDNAKLASEFYRAGKPVSAMCHGPAALVLATDASGKSIFAGKRFTGFSIAEEEYANMVDAVPYEKAKELLWAHVVVDGHLLTGQNPASANPLAEKLVKMLK